MIKFAADDKHGKAVYGFGLSFDNLEKLKEGRPILVDLETMGGQGSVMIFAGATEAAMTQEVVDAGLIDSQTEIRRQSEHHEGSEES